MIDKNKTIEKEELLKEFLTPDRITSKRCVLDGKKQRASSLPTMIIGSYRKMHLCKKQHLVEDEDIHKLINIIDSIAKNINEKGNYYYFYILLNFY